MSIDSLSRILVVRVGALGDTLMATPLIRMLRRAHAEVDFLSSRFAAPLLELNPHVSRLFPLHARNWPVALSPEKRRLVREIESRGYLEAVLLESAPRYRMLLERAQLKQIRSFAETPFDAGAHAIVNNLRVAGIRDWEARDLDMDLPLAPADLEAADRLLQGLPEPRIGVHIGWGPQGRKRDQELRLRGWRHGGFVEVIRGLLERRGGAGIVLTGAAEDERDVARVAGEVSDRRVRPIAGRTRVRELAAVIRKLDLLISVDSGPCHMAAALGTPLVVLWGPGRLEQTRPLSSTTPVRILRHAPPCAPCQSTPLQKTCRRNVCMEAITAEEVLHEAVQLLPG